MCPWLGPSPPTFAQPTPTCVCACLGCNFELGSSTHSYACACLTVWDFLNKLIKDLPEGVGTADGENVVIPEELPNPKRIKFVAIKGGVSGPVMSWQQLAMRILQSADDVANMDDLYDFDMSLNEAGGNSLPYFS